MTNRNERDARRRNYIIEKIQENLKKTVNDNESIFSEGYDIENLNNVKIYNSFGKEI